MISIALAAYNGSKYIREQLDSILEQTYQDFELIICDDCSTDGTWQILEEYAQTDCRIKFFKNEKNLGFKKNFEKAISLCKGEYIALSDQDDIWMANHLELLLNNIGDKMIAWGDALLVDSDNKSLNMTIAEFESFNSFPDNDTERSYTIFYFRNLFQGASMLIRKDFFKIALPIPDDINYHDTWFAALSNFCGGMNIIKAVITRYRRHNANVTIQRVKKRKKFNTLLRHIKQACLTDRGNVALNTLKRVNNLDSKQKKFLEYVIRHNNRKKTFLGRISNAFFELFHYKLIYSCDRKHWW